MATRGGDPYEVLGVQRSASDAELRTAYRRLVQLHHPDHNAGSAESARRFTEVQEAYAQVQKLRAPATGKRRPPSPPPRQPPSRPRRPRQPPRQPPDDPDLESRLADLERELRAARLARERARDAARQAAAAATAAAADTRQAAGGPRRASDEELGYYTTDDSFSKIIADARSELSELYAEARQKPIVKRVADLVDELASHLKE
jgi:curved DNA-binding protein CbpA